MAFCLMEEVIFKRLPLCKSNLSKLNGSHWKLENKIRKKYCSFSDNNLCIYSTVGFFYFLRTHKYLRRNEHCTHDVIRNYNTVDSSSSKVSNKISVKYIKELLTSNNIEFEDGFTCLITKCPVCNTPQEDGMFINKTTGKFYYKGSIGTLYTFRMLE